MVDPMTTELHDVLGQAPAATGTSRANRSRTTRSLVTGLVAASAFALASVALTTPVAAGEDTTHVTGEPTAAPTAAPSDEQAPTAEPSPTASTSAPILSSRQLALQQASRAGLAAGRFRTKAFSIGYARAWAAYRYKWDDRQMQCLTKLWNIESKWRWNAHNRRTGAYGIPQARPAAKMASAGADWKTNPETQIRWGMTYVKSRYGTACGAMAFFERRGYY